MSRIKIKYLPKDRQISRKKMKKIFGSTISVDHPYLRTGYYLGTDPYAVNDPPPAPSHISDWFGGTSSWVDRRK